MAFKKYILVSGGTGEKVGEPDRVIENLVESLKDNNIEDYAQVVLINNISFSGEGAYVKILPDETFYTNVKPSHAKDIVEKHILKGENIKEILFDPASKTGIANVPDEAKDAYNKQFRIVLRNCGIIDPENIDEYIARDGYAALEKAIFEMSGDEIVEELKKSGLRGRGGAGYPTWMKWNLTKQQNSEQKYIVCNADEGDPGAYMDRSTLEGDPHSILEAMAIAGYTIGADKGYIYIRAEYPLAIKRLNIAIEQAKEYGLLGDNILGSDFSFDIELRLGAGAFVCGEETALLASIEGKRGMPVPRPPYPSVSGLWGKPTCTNNVETFANIPVVLLKGGDWFGSIGTETSKGTKVFALTGKIKNSGLIEVPMGITLREIVTDIGGGILGGKEFKAAQTGGPSGGMLPSKYLDTPIDYENLAKLGSIMGSGGLIVMDEDDCAVDLSKFYVEFSVDESCGKCSPCRIGGKQMHGILDKITKGNGELNDIEDLKSIALAMNKASLCGLGQAAPNPVLSTLKHFEDEYLEHINDGKCRAGSCTDLLVYTILEDKCIGCGLCARNCPVNCITGERREAHTIDQDACIKCGQCLESCKFDAVLRG